jgi:hypothetical protein
VWAAGAVGCVYAPGVAPADIPARDL